jgi:hypothetical protein
VDSEPIFDLWWIILWRIVDCFVGLAMIFSAVIELWYRQPKDAALFVGVGMTYLLYSHYERNHVRREL